MEKTIYDLKLHEELGVFIQDSSKEYETGYYISIIRVPGGWIYRIDQTAVFVPFHGEFDPKYYSK